MHQLSNTTEKYWRSTAHQPLGTLGHLGVFLWLLVLVMGAPSEKVPWVTLICGVMIALVYPGVLQKMWNPRWLVLLAMMVIPVVFSLGVRDQVILGIPYSSQGLVAGGKIIVRFFVILMAVQGLTQAISISELAGILERMGLHGLGFSMGVAVNLLPNLEKAYMCAWKSLRMRGGLRKNRWRAIRLLLINVISNALNQAENIALAAEGRAFSSKNARPLPIQRGVLDWLPFSLGIASTLIIYMV